MTSAISIAEFKYPKEQNYRLMFLFYQNSGQCAYADNALVAHKMNVLDGGKQLKTLRGMKNFKS